MSGTVKWCREERGSLLSLPDPQQLLIWASQTSFQALYGSGQVTDLFGPNKG